MISANAMPPQQIPSYPPGANSPMTAGIIKQQQSAEMQNIRNKIGGGPPVVQVPPVPSSSVNADATAANYKSLTQLAQQQSAQSVYDTARSPADTNHISAQQQAFYTGKGGKRKRKRRTRRSKCKTKRSKKRRNSKTTRKH
jgi:hypothetical protein